MTRILNAERREPVSGETRSAVVFLHGYGANGADLLGLADPLGEHLPDTLFVAPDAPEACAGAPMGFQWFPIPWIDNSMMALHVAPRREDAVAGIVAFSGRLLSPESLKDDAVSRRPVLLVHGDVDDVVPPQSLPDAAEALQEAGWTDVFAHIMKGTGHGIAPDGLSVALAFMRDKLSL